MLYHQLQSTPPAYTTLAGGGPLTALSTSSRGTVTSPSITPSGSLGPTMNPPQRMDWAPLLGTAHVPHSLPGTDTSPFTPPPSGNEYQCTPRVTASTEAISPLNTNRTAPLYSLCSLVPTPKVGLLSRRYHSSRGRVILRRWCYVCIAGLKCTVMKSKQNWYVL